MTLFGTTTAEVEGDRIVVRPAIVDALVRVPGGTWDVMRKAWAFAATPASAYTIQKSFSALRASDAFDALMRNGASPDEEPDEASRAVVRAPAPTVVPQLAAQEVLPDSSADAQEFELPVGLRTQPWRHQGAGYKFSLDKVAAGFNGVLLALGMGGGKTLIVFMLILGLAARRVLIACPLRVIPVWRAQYERHVDAPFVIVGLDDDAGSVAKKRALAAEKMRLAEARGVPFIAVINYESVWREPFASWAERQRWDMVVADECHRLKRSSGKASRYFRRLRRCARFRVGLSGTPMPHGVMDIQPIFAFLEPRIFGTSFAAFRQKYAIMGGFQRKQIIGFQNLTEFERKLSQITFRVGKEVLDLPPETHITYYCDLSAEARRVYRDIEDDFVARVLDGTITAANALVKLVRVQQVANGIVKTDDGREHRIDDAKLRLLADILQDIGSEEPVVVFCRFRLDLDAVHEACARHGYQSLELSGRRDELARWQRGEGQVLAVQISAGGTGVDLTRARFSAYYSISFSLSEYDQALSRVHRPGQTRPVEHIHLVARNTVDTKIMHALERRAEVIESILAEIKN